MRYLQIAKRVSGEAAHDLPEGATRADEIDEVDEVCLSDVRAMSSTSSISSVSQSAIVAVASLEQWIKQGVLNRLPQHIPGFVGELSNYADRDRMIGMVRAILDAVPWSLTAYERAEQFVAVLTPLVSDREQVV